MPFIKRTLVLIAFMPLTLLAQKKFKVAILTNLENQTDTVFIQGQNWSTNPKTLPYFSADYTNKGTATVANTSNITVGTERVFERAIIKKSMDKVEYPDLAKRLDSTSMIDTVFLELIVKGQHVNLYSYADQIKTRFYIKDLNEKYQELTFRKFYSAAINFKIETHNIFRDQLKLLTSQLNIADPKTLQKIDNANYTLKDLKEIIMLINSNQAEFTSSTVQKLSFNVGVGLTVSNFTYNAATVLGTSSDSRPLSIVPVLGLSYTLDEMNKSSLNMELAVSKEKADFYGIDNRTEETKSFTQWTYALAPTYSYNVFNYSPIKFTLEGGISANIHSYKDDVVTYRSTEIPGDKAVASYDLGGFHNFSFSLLGRVGIKLKQVTFLTSYVHYLGSMITFSESEILKSSYNFSLRYNFGFKKQ